MLIESEQTPHNHQQQHQQQQLMIMAENNNNTSSGEDHELRAPKKRAETWVQEETRILISLRREVDRFFNTSKSNKHLWEQISSKMRDKGFDRSPTMCTDKWRNLLKEFKKVKHKNSKGSSGSTKMLYYKDLEELIRDRAKDGTYKAASPTSSKLDSFIQFSDKGQSSSYPPFICEIAWEFCKSLPPDDVLPPKCFYSCYHSLSIEYAYYLSIFDTH